MTTDELIDFLKAMSENKPSLVRMILSITAARLSEQERRIAIMASTINELKAKEGADGKSVY